MRGARWAGIAFWVWAALLAQPARAEANASAATSGERLRPCSDEPRPRHGLDLRDPGDEPVCVPRDRPPPRAQPSGPLPSPFQLPSNGFALKAGAHLGAMSFERVGAMLDPGLSYYWGRRFELGVSVQLAWLEREVWFSDPADGEGDSSFSVLPRLVASLGTDDGFARLQLGAGYGPSRMRQKDAWSPTRRGQIWSYAVGGGLSAGFLSVQVQWLGFPTWLTSPIIDGDRNVVSRTHHSAGVMVSIGLVFPIVLSGE